MMTRKERKKSGRVEGRGENKKAKAALRRTNTGGPKQKDKERGRLALITLWV
jgi:hypothetical protein